MFYLSSQKYKGSVEVWGITDTDDGVEEFYTKGMVEKFFKENGIRIHGLTYTGSRFIYRLTNPVIMELESLNKGETFLMRTDNDVRLVMYIGRSMSDDFQVFFGSDTHTITRKLLLNGKVSISKDSVDEEKSINLRKSYKKNFPMSQLTLFLERDYGI